MVTIDLDLTLRVILYLVAIVCLLFCIYFFVKLIKMFGRINTILEKSEESLISSAEKLPDLIENTDKAIVNANEILEKTDEILADKKEDTCCITNSMIRRISSNLLFGQWRPESTCRARSLHSSACSHFL